MLVKDLGAHGAPSELSEALSASGIHILNPPQALALEKGLLHNNRSMVVAAPTASGKTLIAELSAMKEFLEGTGKVIYLVPLRALASEKYDEFVKKYSPMGLNVTVTTGDYDSRGGSLLEADLVITTNEKMDSLLRHRAPWLEEVSLVVADEVHMLCDTLRGPTLEVVLTRMMSMNPELKVLALSATISNARDISEWLDAELVESDWRPVPLREGVFSNGAIIFNDGSVHWSEGKGKVEAHDLAVETAASGGQSLVFVNTRKAAEATAKKLSDKTAELLTEEEASELKAMAYKVLGATREPTRICRKLAECVLGGSAFHHAGINHAQRKVIEDAFRKNIIKTLAATTTLAMGLNLPSRRVVIRDWWRYALGHGIQPLPTMEIKQMCGRAGRPGYDPYGEAVLYAKNKRDERRLFEKYIKGKPEEVESRLDSPEALRSHVLSAVAGGFVRTEEELYGFFGETFSAYQNGTRRLFEIIADIMEFLVGQEMVLSDRRGIRATKFGKRVSELYIDPVSGVMLRDSLAHAAEKTPFALLHMIARTPDMISLSVKKKDYDEMLDIYYAHAESLLITEEERHPSEDMLSELKTASVITQWTMEKGEDFIVGHFGIGPGDLRNMIDLSDWLLFASMEIGKLFGSIGSMKEFFTLRTRIRYGVLPELLELVRLKGIGRVRARNLYDAGITGIKAVAATETSMLALVPAVGSSVAESIKKQAEGRAAGEIDFLANREEEAD